MAEGEIILFSDKAMCCLLSFFFLVWKFHLVLPQLYKLYVDSCVLYLLSLLLSILDIIVYNLSICFYYHDYHDTSWHIMTLTIFLVTFATRNLCRKMWPSMLHGRHHSLVGEVQPFDQPLSLASDVNGAWVFGLPRWARGKPKRFLSDRRSISEMPSNNQTWQWSIHFKWMF